MKLNKYFQYNSFNSLRSKFTLWLIIFIVLIFTTFLIILIRNNVKITRDSISQEATSFVELSTKPVVESYALYYNSGYFKFREVIGRILELSPVISQIKISDTNGEVLFDSQELISDVTKQEILNDELKDAVIKSESTTIFDPEIKDQIQMIVYPYFDDWQAHRYSVIYYISYNEVAQNAARLGNLIIILSVIFMLFGIAVLYSGISRLIVSPIEIVQKGAQQISKGDYKFQITVDTNDEIELLAQSTNEMAKNLAGDIEKLKHLDVLKDEFISLAAHNLRTPVVHIRYDMDYLMPLISKKLDKRQADVFNDIKTSNESLAVLVEDLLNLTTLEKEGLKLVKFMPIDLIGIVNKTIVNYDARIKNKKINLITDYDNIKIAEILGDPMKIGEVIGNLIENAIQFNKNGGAIVIKMILKDKNYLISVQDTGIGIKKEEIGELFKKFHRATSYLTYDYTGKGLGLYIAKMIVDAHNGNIWVESEEGKGSTFFVSFPQKTETSPIPKTKFQKK